MQIKFQRHHIAPLVLFVLLVGSMAGVYQFYFREQLALYAENREKRETLVQIVNRLENSFRGDQGVGVPDVMVAKTRNKVIPYADAVEQRARFFNIEGMQEFNPVAEGDIARFHYQAEYPRAWNELQQKAREARCFFNQGIDFNVPTPDSLAGQQVTRQQVHNWLRRFSFGASMAQMMFDARAREVQAIQVWPDREQGMLTLRTVGFQFTMELADVARFLEGIELESDRFLNLNGFRIVNTNMLTAQAPTLNVEMVVTFAIYRNQGQGGEPGQGPGPTSPGGPGAMPLQAGAPAYTGAEGEVQQMLAQLQARRQEEGGAEERNREPTLWDRWRPYIWPF